MAIAKKVLPFHRMAIARNTTYLLLSAFYRMAIAKKVMPF
jgi:hypothetical protein